MKTILLNLALIELNRFCREHGIPANGPTGDGSHVVKRPRGFTYDLVSGGNPCVSVTCQKSQSRTFTRNP